MTEQEYLKRIDELLECNNTELERRRAAERRTQELDVSMRVLQGELCDAVRSLDHLLTSEKTKPEYGQAVLDGMALLAKYRSTPSR